MKKAFDQTVRDLKREVNKKVLKVPGIEQKVLDATSNEPWGPHGSHLADIAQATRNYNEYQIIMSVTWKRINDTGKNWRHVYKALTVLEYLVANGSERVIDDIKEHSYQISTLSNFQYIDSSGRDQGSNVRKKSQGLVALVNNRERIQEVRQKASANRDKYRGVTSGGVYRSSPYSSPGRGYGDRYDDDHYESRYTEERSGYGREKEFSYKDDERSSPRGDRYSRDRSYSYGDDDDAQRYSSRQADNQFSQQPPPSYEEAVNEIPNAIHNDRDGKPSAFKTSEQSESLPSMESASSSAQMTSIQSSHDLSAILPPETVTTEVGSHPIKNQEADLFDPRASVPGFNFSENNVDKEVQSDIGSNFVPLSSVSTALYQNNEDPFGDAPFKAVQFDDSFGPQSASASSAANVVNNDGSVIFSSSAVSPSLEVVSTVKTIEFQDAPADNVVFSNGNFSAPALYSSEPKLPQENYLHDELRDVLPFLAPAASSTSPGVPAVSVVSVSPFGADASAFTAVQTKSMTSVVSFGFPALPAPSASGPALGSSLAGQATHLSFGQMTNSQSVQPVQVASVPPRGPPVMSLPSGQFAAQNVQEKFEPKSKIWADTLSRGLVDLNISGPKTNPLADIGVDFDSINRQEKRREKEKSSTNSFSSMTAMGKAMGAGSGIGHAGAAAFTPPPNSLLSPTGDVGMRMGSEMGMGLGGLGPGVTAGLGVNQLVPGLGMGMPSSIGRGQQIGPPARPGFQQGLYPAFIGNYVAQTPYGGYRTV